MKKFRSLDSYRKTLLLLSALTLVACLVLVVDELTSGWEYVVVEDAMPVEGEPWTADFWAPSLPLDVNIEELEYSELVDHLEVVELVEDQRQPGQTTRRPKDREQWKPAVLQVVTNFDKAEVTVNGLAYPAYVPPGEPEGMVLPAGGPYLVEVTFDGRTRTYEVHLRPYETRMLMVELTGFRGGSSGRRPAAKAKTQAKATTKVDAEDEGPGQVTVYSKPAGTIIVSGKKQSEKTPGTVDVPTGRHEIQVEYEDGTISEKKVVRVRKGSRIKLFFRQREGN